MATSSDFSLDAKYRQEEGLVFLSGVQALVRLPLDQHRADRRRGLNTATLVSGYRGSPLGGLDLTLERNPDPELLANVKSFTQLAGPEAMDVHMRLVRVLATEEANTHDQVEMKGAAAAVIRALRLRPLYTTLVLAGVSCRKLNSLCATSTTRGLIS